jgi:hypothetical protein
MSVWIVDMRVESGVKLTEVCTFVQMLFALIVAVFTITLRICKMPKYQVVIERCAVYEVEAFNEKDAEDMAWNIHRLDDLGEPFVAEILEITE